VVVPMRGFSALAGSLALAVIVIPVVLRTTEDMLLLVPNPLREAASALGLPRSLVIKRIAYRAARSGLITGVLLATARIAAVLRGVCMMPMEGPDRPYLVVRSGIGGELGCFIRSVADRQVSCRRTDVFATARPARWFMPAGICRVYVHGSGVWGNRY